MDPIVDASQASGPKKLDLSQLANHPLLKQKSPANNNDKNNNNNTADQNNNSAESFDRHQFALGQSPELDGRLSTPARRRSGGRAAGPQTPAHSATSPATPSLSAGKRLSNSSIAPARLGPSHSSAILAGQIRCTPASPQGQEAGEWGAEAEASDNNSNNLLRIRRSTSLSYTSALRKRQQLSPLMPEAPVFLSPKPNVVLPNFSISAYGSGPARRLNYNVHDSN